MNAKKKKKNKHTETCMYTLYKLTCLDLEEDCYYNKLNVHCTEKKEI